MGRLVRRPAASVGRARRIDGGVALLDISDLPVFIDHESRAIRHAGVLDEHAVGGRRFAFREIAQERDRDVVLGRELALRRRIIGADSKNLRAAILEFSDTSLVRQKFLRSTTGERRGIEREHYRVLASKIRELDPAPLSRWQVEIGGGVAHLQSRLRRRNSLSKQARRGEQSERDRNGDGTRHDMARWRCGGWRRRA